MSAVSYEGYPEREFEFVKRLTIEIRRLRSEFSIKTGEEITLLHEGDCPLTEGGKSLLKKLANAVVASSNTSIKGTGKTILIKH